MLRSIPKCSVLLSDGMRMLSLQVAHFFAELLGLGFGLDKALGILGDFFVSASVIFLEPRCIVSGELSFLLELCKTVITFLNRSSQAFRMLPLMLQLIIDLSRKLMSVISWAKE